MRVLRRLFGRSQMDEREVKILEGIWSQNGSRFENREKREVRKPFPGSSWRRVLKGNAGNRSYYFFIKALMMSIGTGKMVVEFFSVEISAKV
jgi:hypothetical protein